MTIRSAFCGFLTGAAVRADLTGNSLVTLSDTTRALLVEQGVIDLFAVRLEAGQPAGRWIPLGRALAGTVLVAPPAASQRGIVGRADPDAVLSYVPVERFSGLSGHAAGALAPAEAATAARQLVHGIQAGMRAIAGSLPSEDQACLPELDWLAAGGEASLVCRSAGDLLADGSLWPAIAGHQARLLDAVDRGAARREAQERAALASRAAAQSAAVQAVARSFDAVVRGRRAGRPDGGWLADAGDPGAPAELAAVRLVASAMGFSVRAPAAREAAGTAMDPVQLIALANGVRTRQVKLDGRWWRKDIGPLLGRRKRDGRVLALLPVRGSYAAVDPAANTATRLTGATAAEFDQGTVLYRPLPADVHRPGALLRFAVSGARGDLLRIGWTSLVVAAIGLLAPIMTGWVLGGFAVRAQRGLIVQGALLVIGGAFVAAAISVVQNIAALRLEGRAAAALQSAIWSRLLSLPVSFFSQHSTGDLAVSALGVNEAQEVLSGVATVAALGLLTGSLNLILVFFYDLPLALIAVLLITVCASVCSIAGYRQVVWQRRIYDNRRLLSSQVFQLLTGLPKIRAAAAEDRAFVRWSATFTRGRVFAMRARRVQNLLTIFTAAFPLTCSVVIFGVVAGPLKGEVPIATFLAFNAAFTLLTTAILQFTVVAITSMSVFPLLERLKPILTQEPEAAPGATSPGELRGQITLSHVSFRYADNEPLALDDVSFAVDPGEFVAIVGPTGCGKSTIVRLLLGFDTATAGSVLFDGQDITALNAGEVRRQCGVVLQNGELLSGDIKSNILGSTGYTVDNAWAAARMACVEEDIAAMPMGMNTIMSEGGTTLSGGQRQRILIARALVSRPRVIFFDEATSALDNPTQAAVGERVRQLNATRIIIAHRLSSVADADRIIVMDKGRIVQCGRYEELLADDNGLFASLARQQLS
jgi:NHLM bacteriocin system ABC transporter ATP-binding protein